MYIVKSTAYVYNYKKDKGYLNLVVNDVIVQSSQISLTHEELEATEKGDHFV